MSWVKDLFDGLATLFGIPPAVQELKYKQKIRNKEHKKYLKKQFNDFFAFIDYDELKFLMLLVCNNNAPQKVSHAWDFHYDWQVEINGTNEFIFQIIEESNSIYSVIEYQRKYLKRTIRINPVVWPIFVKEFNKRARARLSGTDVESLNFEDQRTF